MAQHLPCHTDPALYDAVADAWWSDEVRWLRTLRNLVPARLAHFDPLVGDWRDRRVLDLGCAGGFMAEAVARRGARVTGLDPAAVAVRAAARHAAEGGLAIDYICGIGERLPFTDSAFDTVLCVDVLEHVQDLAAVIAEVHRVLAPGGLFLFDTINRTLVARLVAITLAERLLRLLPPATHHASGFIRPGELRRLLDRHGFSVGRMAGLGPRGLDRRLDITFGSVPTTAILYVGHARKCPPEPQTGPVYSPRAG